MENDQKWNKLSTTDAHILALTSLLLSDKKDSSSTSNRRKRKCQNDENDSKNKENDTDSSASSSFKYPEWRLKPPAEIEPTTKEVEGKTFHWCSKDHGRTKGGLWGTHKKRTTRVPVHHQPSLQANPMNNRSVLQML